MKISTKGRYALRMVIELAKRRDDGFTALREIAQNQNISKKYLEQIIPILNINGLLQTNRGSQGGYKLAADPAKCTVGEILRLTEGNLAPVACLECDPVQCERRDECDTLPVWKGLYNTITGFLDSITIQDIIDRNINIAADMEK